MHTRAHASRLLIQTSGKEGKRAASRMKRAPLWCTSVRRARRHDPSPSLLHLAPRRSRPRARPRLHLSPTVATSSTATASLRWPQPRNVSPLRARTQYRRPLLYVLQAAPSTCRLVRCRPAAIRTCTTAACISHPVQQSARWAGCGSCGAAC